jgi:hypothetical protein
MTVSLSKRWQCCVAQPSRPAYPGLGHGKNIKNGKAYAAFEYAMKQGGCFTVFYQLSQIISI